MFAPSRELGHSPEIRYRTLDSGAPEPACPALLHVKRGIGMTQRNFLKRKLAFAALGLICLGLMSCATMNGGRIMSEKHGYNGPYTGRHLNRVAFPIGGIGAGMVCLEGSGAISHVSVRNRMEFFHEPCTFAALCVKGEENVARVLEGPIPDRKYFGAPGTGNGAGGMTYGLPRFREASFLARFPFATVNLADPDIPLDVSITGWSPFVPGDADASSLPVGALEYRFKNSTGSAVTPLGRL